MSSIVNLISDYAEGLLILPIMSFMALIITILIHLIFSKEKIVKYIPSLLLLGISLIIGIIAFTTFTTAKGLNLAWVFVYLFTSAAVGIFTALIIDLINGVKKDYYEYEKQHKK